MKKKEKPIRLDWGCLSAQLFVKKPVLAATYGSRREAENHVRLVNQYTSSSAELVRVEIYAVKGKK